MPVIAAILLNLATTYLAMRRAGTWLNPFSGIMVFFALSGIFFVDNPLVESANVTSEAMPQTEWYIFAFSLGFFLLTFLLKPEAFRPGPAIECLPVPMTAILGGCFAFCLIGTVMLYRRNGGMPVFLMSQSFAAGRGTGYQDYLIPFVTPLTWGLSRFMFLLLCLDYLTRGESLIRHVTRNWLNYGLAAAALILVLGAALRNVLVWPVLFYLFGIARLRGVTRLQTVGIAGVLAVLTLSFVVVGNYRMGSATLSENPMGSILASQVDNPILATLFAWIASYTGTCYFNLNAIIQVPPDPSYGLLILTEIVPDSMIENFVTVPDTAIDYLSLNGLLPYFGLTFRTVFTDLYADFGYVGSLLAGLALYWFSIFAYNRAGGNQRWLCLYLCILPGLLMFPFVNFFTGIASLAPVALAFACVRFRPAPAKSAPLAPLLAPSAPAHGLQ